MCDPTYPIIRTGSILKTSRVLSAQDAVVIAERLYDRRDDATNACIAALESISNRANKVDGIQPSAEIDAVRIRTMPALTIDFPPIGFRWRGHRMEFRACATVCSGDRKAKLWLRYAFREKQESKALVREFFDWIEGSNAKIHDALIAFYNSQLKHLQPDISLERTYEVIIRLMSVKSPELKAELDREFKQAKTRSATSEKAAAELLMKTIDDCGLTLPNKEIGDQTFLVGFSYPRHRRASEVSQDDGLERTWSPSIAEEDFGALCIVDHDKDVLRITGVAHETEPPGDHRRSAPHVISGEISFEVGNAF